MRREQSSVRTSDRQNDRSDNHDKCLKSVGVDDRSEATWWIYESACSFTVGHDDSLRQKYGLFNVIK